MVRGEGKGWGETHGEGQLGEGAGRAVPAPRARHPDRICLTNAAGRKRHGEDKTQAWGGGVRRPGARHPFVFTSHPLPTLQALGVLPFRSQPPGSHSWLGWALPVPPGTFLGA